MSSDTALSSAIRTSIPADSEFYNGEDGDSNSSAGVGVIVVADDLHDGIRPSEMDLADDMPPLPDSSSELPSRVIATTRSHSDVSGSVALKSWVWNYFKKADAAGKHCLCLLCNQEVNYSFTKSTGALAHHVKRFHKSVWEQHLREKAEVSISSGSASTLSIDAFLKHCPRFEKCLVQWMIATYQP
jgi:hypothetical protein